MKKLIMIVDDEEPIRMILTDFLGSVGYRVVALPSPFEARKAFEQETPQLVISDLQLEFSDGLAMIEQLKQSHKDLPVILLTGILFDAKVADSLTSKKTVSAYLPKTTPLSRILAEVHRLIGDP